MVNSRLQKVNSVYILCYPARICVGETGVNRTDSEVLL